MCKLRDEAMDRSGELPMEKKMDEGMSKRLANLSGAAVRGEAVAESVADLREFHELAMDYRGAVAFTTAPTAYKRLCAFVDARVAAAAHSARAADAPSEPSERFGRDCDLLTMVQVNAIRDTIKPGDGWDGDNWDFALANAVAAKVKSRAADALDSQPTARIAELESQLAECVALSQKWASAAGEADGRAERFREALSDTLQFLGDMHSMPVDWTISESQVVYGRIRDLILPPDASNRPTDGEVRK
jgi:hypothetical protein